MTTYHEPPPPTDDAEVIRPLFGVTQCPFHIYMWEGRTGELCGQHGGPKGCTQPGQPLTMERMGEIIAYWEAKQAATS